MTNSAKHDAMANAIRILSLDSVERAKSGHLGLPLGAADIASVLFSSFLTFDPKAPDWPNRDRFVLSAGTARCCFIPLFIFWATKRPPLTS